MFKLYKCLAAYWVVFFLTSCGDAAAPRPRTILNTDSSDPSPGNEELPDQSQDANPDTSTPDSGPTEDEMAAIYKQCQIDPDFPSNELYQGDFTALPITISGSTTVIILPVSYTVTLFATMQVKSTALSLETLTDVTSQVTPSSAQAKADEEVQKRSGPKTFDLMPLEQRRMLGSLDKNWKGINCSIAAATHVTAVRGGKSTSVAFSPALPAAVSPLLDATLYASEIGASRTFGGIVATVDQSSSASLPVGSKYTGIVTVRKIDPTYSFKRADGTTQMVGGDIGFEVVTNFGSAETTIALGLNPSVRYFIDSANRTLKALVTETGETGVGPIVMINNARTN